MAENLSLILGVLCAYACFVIAQNLKSSGEQGPNIFFLAALLSALAGLSTGIVLAPLIEWVFYGAGSFSLERMLPL